MLIAEPEFVQIKGAHKPVAAQRLLGMEERHRFIERVDANLVGRRWEMFAVENLLDRAIEGHGNFDGIVTFCDAAGSSTAYCGDGYGNLSRPDRQLCR